MEASVVETHISTVFFVGDHAYKLKKPVRFDFVDQSTRTRRAALCAREVVLNRRLAPDVYEGVATVLGPDHAPCDELVVMKRLPPERRLSSLIRAGDPGVGGAVDRIGTVLAAFHAGCDRSPAIDRQASQAAVGELWAANVAQLERFCGSVLDRDVFDRCRTLAERFVRGRRALFDARIAGGWICDGHGDLLAGDIFVLDDGPRIIDCLEFADHLRWGDVAADLAFLAMDIEHLGAPELAERLVATYERASGARFPEALLHHWIAYRAQVRCLVACLRSEQELADGDARAAATADDARALLELSLSHLRRAVPLLVLVGGLPGTGKSTLAAGIADALGATVVRSDVVRKELAGMAPTVSGASEFGTGLYSPDQIQRTYDEILERAATALALGRDVVVDASFIAEHERALARRCADDVAQLVELRCALPAAEAHRRIQARADEHDDPSDADPLVAARMAEIEDPWIGAIPVSTAGTADEALATALEAIGAQR